MAGLYGRKCQDIRRKETLPGFSKRISYSNNQPKDGKTYVMHHGTTVQAAKQIIKKGFKPSAKDKMLGPGVYASRDIRKAERYPLDKEENQVLLKLKVDVGRVKKIEHQGHPLQKTWHDHGYDTAWVPPHCGMVKSNLEENCVYDPKRVKVVGIEKAPYGKKTALCDLVKQNIKK